jgi:hypothetical protein
MVSLSELNGFEKRFWNGFGTDLGIWWELFGNCLGIVWNYPILIISYLICKCGNCLGIVWELFGNCLGIVWEFQGLKRGRKGCLVLFGNLKD